jgi:hypothetical protein
LLSAEVATRALDRRLEALGVYLKFLAEAIPHGSSAARAASATIFGIVVPLSCKTALLD